MLLRTGNREDFPQVRRPWALTWQRDGGRNRRGASAPRRLHIEPLESRHLLDVAAAWGAVLTGSEVVAAEQFEISALSGDFDWQEEPWGVKVTNLGTPGSPSIGMDLPDGTSDIGNALEVYYTASESDVRQFWVFLTDGFSRQVSYDGTWGTSSRLFRYFSSGDQNQDVCQANHFQVVEATEDGQLRLILNYDNDDPASGDRFDIRAELLLDPPTQFETAATAAITVTNASGRDVTPFWQGHRELAEQWELFGLSSMYVADHLTGGLPDWYDSLDPGHNYVGNVDDAEYLNDGFSVNGQVQVSTHDVKRIDIGSATVDLNHDVAICPPVTIPGYEWYQELVMLDQPGRGARLTHLHDPARQQRVELVGASGITSAPDNLKWAVTYNRNDANMVDGDNVQIKLGIDDFLDVWPDGASQTIELRLATGSRFPFTISDARFLRDGTPVFLNILGYQPLEPGQAIDSEMSLARIRDDLRRLEAYQAASDPVVLRTYAQPTAAYPVRMPKEFYDGARELGFWIIRDIYFESFNQPDSIEKGKAAIDAVIQEVEAVGSLDRIFAWEFGNEFVADAADDIQKLHEFLGEMRDYLKNQMSQPGRAGASNWVTWGAFPANDLLRTGGNPIRVAWDFYSINAYSYDPEKIRDHQAGPVTGTPYAGYLKALADEVQRLFPGSPLVISETGLPDSPAPVDDAVQDRLAPWYPDYRKGGLGDQQLAEGFVDRYIDARLSGLVAGIAVFEWNDEWHKAGAPNVQNHPEEHYGLGRFEEIAGGGYELRYKLQQESVRDLFTLNYSPEQPIIAGLVSDDSALAPGETTTVRVAIDPGVAGPVRFRWESSRGRIVGDSDTVQFYAGNVALGPAEVTVLAIDAAGNAHTVSTTIEIAPGDPEIEIFTLGQPTVEHPLARISGRVANADLGQYKVVVYVEVPGNFQYVQPYADVPLTFVGPDGYWWSEVHRGGAFDVIAWLVPVDFEPVLRPAGSAPPEGTLAEARIQIVNDTDNDHLSDDWEIAYLGGLSEDRYGDPDGDAAYNLEEFLAGRAAQFVGGSNPAIPDNDADGPGGAGDGLPDNWEYRYFKTLSYGPSDDPDSDGIDNAGEYRGPASDSDDPGLGTHPGRTAPDRDQDGLPDRWEIRFFNTLAAGAGEDPNGDGLTNLDAYELGLSPVLSQDFFHTEGRDIVADATGEKMTFRGVNLTGLEYGAFFDYPYPGQEGQDYSKPWAQELSAIAGAGLNLIRLPIEWARLVPGWKPGDPLPAAMNSEYVAMVDDVVAAASRQGLYVILDMHDFLKYWSGRSAQVEINDSVPHQELLARTWQLLAGHYAAEPAVLGFDLMNEPIREGAGSSNWHAIAQFVVDAIRSVDENHLIIVEGPNYSLASSWPVDNPGAFITDTIAPPRIVYSPHIYVDRNNDSLYDQPGEQDGPVGLAEYYVRDRLMPAIDWSIEHDVPILIGELGVPCTTEWAGLLDGMYEMFFDPLEISTAAWQYIEMDRWPYLPVPELNLAGCNSLLDALAAHPGGPYVERSEFSPRPGDSLIYDEPLGEPYEASPVNPWQDGSWNSVGVDFAATGPVFQGDHSIRVDYQGDWGGLKFVHAFGIDTARFATLTFQIYATSSDLDFKIFTTGPLPGSAEYPPIYDNRASLSDYVTVSPGQWQLVEIPLWDIVDPAESTITGIAFQDDNNPDAPFYLDVVRLTPLRSLGVVDFARLDWFDLSQGDVWYGLTTMYDGWLTLETTAPDVQIALFDSAFVPLGDSAVIDGGARLDDTVSAGEAFYARLRGAGGSADLRIANLVHHEGDTVTVRGTAGTDPFAFDARAGYKVTINGVDYQFTEAEASRFLFDGLGGDDDVHFIGASGPDTATLRPTSGIFSGNGYSLDVTNVASLDYDGGQGDTVTIWGSRGANTYAAEPGSGEMTGDGVSIRVTAENLYARGYGGGDTVLFGDSAGDDVLEYFSWWARMRGDGYFHHVRGFKTMRAQAELGQNGMDRVVVRGSNRNDYLKVNPYNTTLETSVVRFLSGSGSVWHFANGFDTIVGYGLGGALIDQLFLNDTPGADTFDVRRLQATLDAPDYAVTVTTRGFGTVEVRRVHANEEADEISLGDSPRPDHNDTLVGDPDQVTMSGPGYVNKALDFPSVKAYSSAGYDTAHFSDLADPNDSRTGVDTFTGRPLFSQLEGSGYKLWARLFEEVYAESKYGRDIADLHGNANGAELTGTATEVRLSGTHSAGSYANHARSYHEVNAFGASDADRAVLTDATVDPPGYGQPGDIVLDDLAQILWLNEFEKIERWDGASGNKIDDIDDIDRVFTWWE